MIHQASDAGNIIATDCGLCEYGSLTWEYICKAENDFIFHEIFIQQLYMQEGISILDGDIILDVGANIGLFSLFCSSIALDITLVAVEPIQDIFQVLRRNLSGVVSASVFLINAALGNPVEENERTDTFSFYPAAPGESTRWVEERDDRHTRLRAAIAEQPDGELKDSLHASDTNLNMAMNGKQAVSFICKVFTLHEVISQCNLICIDLLKVLV